MASHGWKSSLSASDRYERVMRIQDEGSSMSEAIAREQQAYLQSSTQEEYQAACRPPPAEPPKSSLIPDLDDEASSPSSHVIPHIDTGIRIGPHENCLPIADGITSEVYRSGDKALKVIVAHSQNLEPHNPQREVRILESLRQQPSIIQLLSVFRDQEQRMVLEFPFMPMTLADLLDKHKTTALEDSLTASIISDVLHGLQYLHAEGIIHRDIKPSAILLSSSSGAGQAYISDFGTAWHPTYSSASEPLDGKVLDIGTGAYRAPETLFGDRSYGSAVDMWALGVVLAECITSPPAPIFESRPAHEDGNQLGLILSIFKTLGTPTPETWPEAKGFKITPFELWTVFPSMSWEEILPDVSVEFRELVAALVRYDGQRASAQQVSETFVRGVDALHGNHDD